MSAETGYPAASGKRGAMRAADADRDRVAGILGTAFSEGRLSKDEYDARLTAALSARTYADLDQVLTDLPVPQNTAGLALRTAEVSAVTSTNWYAVASLACGLGQFVFGPLTTIPAIVFGHMARKQIRRTGEQGDGFAVAGLVLGWGAVLLAVIGVIVALVAVAGMHAVMGMH